MTPPNPKPIVLYDGVCGLCNGLVRFLLKRDTDDRLRFASLQSDFANVVLRRHDRDPHDLDTVYVVIDYQQPNERLLARSDAIFHLAGEIGGVWRLGMVGCFVPKLLRDTLYKLVAKNRYRLFGKYDSCRMPKPGDRDKFLEV